MAHGGARPGSGRKPGIASILAEKTRAYIAEQIQENIAPMVAAQIEKANNGDTVAFKELMDRGFGKPLQSVDHTTDGKELPMPILNLNVLRDHSNEEDSETQEED